MLVYLLPKQVGPIAFGTINGRFACRGKGGCQKSLCVVLPTVAPTPAAWARTYRPRAGDREADLDMPDNYFPFHIEQWQKDGAVLGRHMGQVVDLEAANACFDRAVATLPKFGNPYITIRHQGRVLRDSRRDFKLLPGSQGD